jgi:hypothetical protein
MDSNSASTPMKTPDELYAAAMRRIEAAIEARRGEADYCEVREGAFVLNHDRALAQAAAEAIGLQKLFEALCDAQAALGERRAFEAAREGRLLEESRRNGRRAA